MNSRYEEAMNTPISETARSRYSFAPGVIEGPDADDFLQKRGALHGLAMVFWFLVFIASAAEKREAAAAEQRRLDAEAAARRAAEEIAHARDQRIRAAAHEMLHALKSIENDDGCIPEAIWQLRCDAIELATGEPA